ncbi:outer membrane beta-barrel protein [Chitinophaga sp. HK235]|uniref:outer membrane beta-barrel protein n=1 Tax=Chitinophaga sp. HK235 TaxID=2952571 RepID=UPI001BA709E8|nr:outer membrane beta-barrel protein [Chitinophaga sp. HK235]
MKQIFLSVLAVSAFLSSHTLRAQQKKNFVSLGFNYYDSNTKPTEGGRYPEKVSSSGFSIAPAYGYYLNEHWALGIQLSYSSSKQGISQYKTNFWTISPFVRYEQSIWNKLSVYADGSLGVTFGSIDAHSDWPNNVYYPKTKETNYGLNITPGLLFHITPAFSVTMNLGSMFSANRTTTDVGDTKNNYTQVGLFKNFGINNIQFGVNFHF